MNFSERFVSLFKKSPLFAAATVWTALSLLMWLRSVWH